MKKSRFLSLFAFLALSLSSCSFNIFDSETSSSASASLAPYSITKPGEQSSSSSKEDTSSSQETPTTTEKIGYSKWNYNDVNNKSHYYVTPSLGSPKIIIVPVEFSDLSEKWSEERLAALNIALNGSDGKGGETPYWESVSSYYAKSSYGRFTPSFVISDVLSPSLTGKSFVKKEENDGEGVDYIMNHNYSDITVDGKKIDVDDYDLNSDGYIDGIFFLYNEFDYDYIYTEYEYWAYVYYFMDNDDIPIHVYGNMGAGFFYEENEDGYDPHTFIHEFGHSMGLDDYYSYDDGVKYSASGELMMSDLNIGDHDAFSKYSLGWVDPYLAAKNSQVTLNSFESSGDALILPSGYWNGSAFSEYYIIDFYHEEGLGTFDAEKQYGNRPLYFKENGVRVYHVDARLGKISYNSRSGGETLMGYLSSSASEIPEYSESQSSSSWYQVVSSDSIKTRSYNGKNLISFVPSDNSVIYNRCFASDKLTWKEGSTISLSTASSTLSFGKWNSGSTFDWVVHIDSITDSQAILTIS